MGSRLVVEMENHVVLACVATVKRSDGKATFAGLLSAGNVRDIDFQHTAVIRVGNAAAAEIYMDGKSLGSLGAPGAVKIVEISGAGLRSLPVTLAPETECQPTP